MIDHITPGGRWIHRADPEPSRHACRPPGAPPGSVVGVRETDANAGSLWCCDCGLLWVAAAANGAPAVWIRAERPDRMFALRLRLRRGWPAWRQQLAEAARVLGLRR